MPRRQLGSTASEHLRHGADLKRMARRYAREALGFLRRGRCDLALNRIRIAHGEAETALYAYGSAQAVSKANIGSLFNRVQMIAREIESRCVVRQAPLRKFAVRVKGRR